MLAPKDQKASIKAMLYNIFLEAVCYDLEEQAFSIRPSQQKRKLRLRPKQSRKLRAEHLILKSANVATRRPTNSVMQNHGMIDGGTVTDANGERLSVPCHRRGVHVQMWTRFQCTTFRAYVFFEMCFPSLRQKLGSHSTLTCLTST